MNKNNEVITKLIEFRECDKFQVYGHLQPAVENSTEEDKKYINEEMNSCVSQLLPQLAQNNISDSDLKKIVRNSLEKIEDAFLDTEDREFCYELYFKIGEILGIDIEDKSKTLEQKMMEDLQRAVKKTGLSQDELSKIMKEAGIDPDSLPK